MKSLLLIALVVAVAAALVAPRAHGDEGMWLFNNPPKDYLKKTYDFEVKDDWLEHVQKSSVRFNSGGSGSFVSADGLVLTNHHVGLDQLQKMSTKEKNYVKDGFHAKTQAEEVKATDLELNVLMSIQDVTERVNAAVKPEMKPEEAFLARRKVTADIREESFKKTGLRSDVVTLYQGGQYHLYVFKKYTDVRLVFAPEKQIAFFGGDPDNFEFPRYDLDICLFRVYEDDKPAKIQHYLTWSKDGAKDGELVFVSGHPGRTNRLNTMAEVEYFRDRQYPQTLQLLNRLEVLYSTWSMRDKENARRALDELFGIQNSRKARIGGLAGLMDPAFIARKKSEEKRLREAVAADSKLKQYAGAWDKIEAAVKRQKELAQDYNLLEGGRAFNSDLFGIARELLRGGEERTKPNGERLPEFVDNNLESLEQDLFSEKPIHDDFEVLKLTNSLSLLAETLGYDHPTTRLVLGDKSPGDRARELITGTKLKDVKERKRLWEGGKKAVDESKDPLIALAKLVDADARKLRKALESEVAEVKQQAYGQIAKARYAIEGASSYPDATFTLRLSFGVVKGYEEDGKKVPPITVFEGLFKRSAEHDNQPPFDLPERWLKSRDKLDLKTPFNFVATADIIGGNSGSPVINRAGEFVGIIFDGNIQSLVADFMYTEVQGRAVSVHSAGITEALRKVYDANDLAQELTTGKRPAK